MIFEAVGLSLVIVGYALTLSDDRTDRSIAVGLLAAGLALATLGLLEW